MTNSCAVRTLLVAVGLALASCSDVVANVDRLPEAGTLLSRHYSPRDYDGHQQNWAIAADAQGILYFGNHGCVLEFDGVGWRKIVVPNAAAVRGLARADNGTIYVGAANEFGFIDVSTHGGKQFVSLRERLPADHRDFGEVANVVATKDGVFFAAGARLFRWHDEEVHVWQLSEGEPLTVHAVDGRVFVHRRGEALLRVNGEALEPFCDAAFFREQRIVALIRTPVMADGDVVAVSVDAGLVRIGEDGGARAFTTDADAWLRREGVVAAAYGHAVVALASRHAGVVLLGPAGKFLRRLDERDGLHEAHVRAIAVNNQQLWLGHGNGVTRLTLPLSATVFGRDQGLRGSTVRAVVRHRGAIHVATERGGLRLMPVDRGRLENARFVAVPGLDGRYFSMLSVDDGLLVGGSRGVEFLPDGGTEAQVISDGAEVMALAKSQRVPERVWAGTTRGLLAIDRTEKGWVVASVNELKCDVRSVAEMENGELWLGTMGRGVARIMVAGNEAVEFFGELAGVSSKGGAVQVARAGAEVIAADGDDAVLRFDRAAGRFVPVNRGRGSGQMFSTAAPLPPEAWVAKAGEHFSDTAIYAISAGGALRSFRQPGLFEAIGRVQHVYGEAEDAPESWTMWIAGADGFGRLEIGGALGGMTLPPDVRLRGAMLDGREAWPADNRVPAGAHHMAFHFSASAYADWQNFATRLDGWETEWTEFSAQRTREFANLPPGRYVLHARARNRNSAGNPRELFAFTIAAPWWATWWARAGAAAIGLAGAAGAVRWRVRSLRRRNENLESIVAARTVELRASQEQLLSARDAAEAANRAKSAFLASMSHELRTPLNGILGYAQVMAKDAAIDSTNRERLRVVRESGQHLLNLINEVLDLSKVEAGKIELRAVACDLPRLIASVADIFRPRAAELGLEFRAHAGDELPRTVSVDEARLTQVLVNLLANAFKFTKRGAVVFSVTRARAGDCVRFAVEDTGVGIAAEDLARIFRPFVQVGDAANGNAAGTGLGLAISQRIVGVLGGELRVESDVGRGSRFWFELALTESDAIEAERDVASAGEVTGYVGARRRVLVIDDHPVNADVLVQLLAPIGFAVRAAGDGAEALEIAVEFAPDLVLLDLRMTPMDGIAVARELRRRPEGCGMKIVAVSASAFEFDRQDALRAGCDGFLPKPFEEAVLLEEIRQQLGLTWTRPVGAKSAAMAKRPPNAIVEELRVLAVEGKVPRLRRRLAGLSANDGEHAAFYAEIDALAARFELQQIENRLARS